MRIGVAEARERFREMLDRVGAGEVVQVTRHGEVVAVTGPPSTGSAEEGSFDDAVRAWRAAWDVGSWPDDDPFSDVRDADPGRPAAW